MSSALDRSILNDVKKKLGLEMVNNFDFDIISCINAALNKLTQLGCGPEGGFIISDESAKWSDFFDDVRLYMIVEYVFMSVKTSFDPSASATLMDCYKSKMDELEWRIREMADPDRHGFDLPKEEPTDE